MTKRTSANKIFPVVMFLSGILAGWTNENMAVAIIFFLISVIVLYRYEKQEIPQWIIWGSAGAVIGAALLILAPGNYIRLGDDSFLPTSDRLYIICKNYYHHMFILFWIYLAVFIFYIKRSNANKIKVRISLLFFISAHVGFLAMSASPEFPPRTLFGPVTFLIIACGILYTDINLQKDIYVAVKACLLVVLLVFLSIDYIDKYKYTKYLNEFWHQREVFVQEQKAKGIMNIKLNDRQIFHEDFILYRISDDPNAWINRVYSRYQGINSIILPYHE